MRTHASTTTATDLPSPPLSYPLCARSLWQTFFYDAASGKMDSKKKPKRKERERKETQRQAESERQKRKTRPRDCRRFLVLLSVFFFALSLSSFCQQCHNEAMPDAQHVSFSRPSKSRWMSEMPRRRTFPRQRSVHCVVLWHVAVHFFFVIFLYTYTMAHRHVLSAFSQLRNGESLHPSLPLFFFLFISLC